ncbi:S-adenosylmethionine decarboxylase family protein [Novipirellula sp. SH528]|uniref:S-adenosylmethionine decarboxylase family protein n=1 Tax=Novipirellula sp. SH528 TaxID=3454466 RepID=UPI003FA0CEE0
MNTAARDVPPIPIVDSPLAVSARVGTEWIVDAYGCSASALQDLEIVSGICLDVITELGLRVVGQPQQHVFPGHGGVTAMYMLSESHLACHTYPEHRLATFNLYCCSDRPAWSWQQQLESRLGASEVVVRKVVRGTHATDQNRAVDQINTADPSDVTTQNVQREQG